jgi:ribosomal protein S20
VTILENFLSRSRSSISPCDRRKNMSMAMQGSREKTTDLTLTTQERNELRLALRTYVTDLRMEIAHTDRDEFREELKARRAVLEEVLRRLGGASKDAREAE